MKTAQSPPRAGFTLVEIMIVVAIIGLLAAIAIPTFVHARARARTATTCINTLKQIETAVQQVDFVKGLAPGDTVNLSDITPYIKLNANNEIPPCPASGLYIIEPVGSNPQAVCSLSNSIDPPHILE